ncbi:MAG: LacI family DNA-binding transcriptional regulator [Mycobacteriales bacterium]
MCAADADAVKRRASIKDVAARAGVSVGTVSNVLNNPERVADDTRERVREAIVALGFVRSGAARQLRAGTSRAVGAVVLDMANPFFTDVARGVEDRLAESDRILILCSTDESPQREQRYLQLLEEQGVLGILITPASPDMASIEAVQDRGTAVVLLDRRSKDNEICSVAVDDVKGGDLAARHLIDMGHQRIGLLNGPSSIRQCADRRRGVRRAMRAAGLVPDRDLIEVIIEALNTDAGDAAVDGFVRDLRPPTAIICVNDLAALGVVRGLTRHEMRVPDDMSVIGYDDLDFTAMLATPLTSIRQPRHQIGYAAAELLLAAVADGPTHRHRQVLFQPELVVRDSSSRPARSGRRSSSR